MATKQISGGTTHKLPTDLKVALVADKTVLDKWESLTALARNEWICWTVTVKQAETRKKHIDRTVTELSQGKRRPCCWMGCTHRIDKSISPSAQWVLMKKKNSGRN